MANALDKKINSANIQRKNEAYIKLERKVLTLRRFYIEGLPTGVSIPKSMSALRLWIDINLGLQKIGSPGTTNRRISPDNEKLISEAEELIEKLRHISDTRKRVPYRPLEQKLRAKAADVDKLEKLVKTLSTQIVQLRSQLNTLLIDNKYAKINENDAKDALTSIRQELIESERKLDKRLKPIK